ncbi:uncharacterized protein, partial [Temnothorax nylanderi]|uniref:uncharacterized protein n=1 Tax=Temnothorax nylanderi TaxID=102681 RepID=UPI003A87AF77
SPLYNIASYLHTILEDTLPKPKSYVKDSWSFVKIIKDVTISPDHILVSFDVTSLFTNIPKDLVLKGIEKRWHFISPHTNFSLPQFLHAVDLILSSTSFCFNGQFYEQIFGSPMGSPFSPKASDIVMEDLESECLGALDFEILLFRRIKELQHRRDTENAPKNLFDPRRSFVLPYVKGLGDDIRLMLNKIGLVAVHTVPKKLDVVIRRGKDRLDRNSSTELVYRINCDNCCASYIGQTKRHLKTRITEHFRDIRKDDSNHSVVSKHRVSLGHDFKWSDVEVLHREKNKKKREIAEMFLIKKYPDTINLKKDTDNLNPIYDKVISCV